MDKPRIRSLAVPTRNRPIELGRAVESYARAAERDGRVVQFLIVDDSDRRHTRARNKRVATAAARDRNCECAYYGPAERAALSQRIALRSGAPQDVVDFALLGAGAPVAPGALRNTILLATAGHAVLQTDDDTTAYTCHAPTAGMAGEDRNLGGAFEMHFLSPGIDLDRTPIWSNGAIYDAHEAVLGQSVNGTAPRTGIVRMTQTGVIGDSGFGFPWAMLFLHGHARERLVASKRVYQAALMGSGTLRSYPGTAFCSSAFCMSTHFALDNRVIMPPFMPLGRNEDGVFGWLFWRCSADALTAFLPLVVRHARPGGGAAGGRRAPVGASSFSSLLLQLMASVSSTRTGGTEAHLTNVGVALEALGTLPDTAFRERARDEHVRFLTGQAQRLQQLLSSGSELPRFWQNDVIAYLCALAKPQARHERAVGADLRWHAGDDHLARFQQVVRQFGRLLQWWPRIWSAAAGASPA